MKIVCLVKQIPRADAIEFNPETKSLRREGVPLLLNPFDTYALAEATRIRAEQGGEVVAITMGPPAAEEMLRECLARGADRCIHLSDRLFAVADTLGTSRTLAMAIEREHPDLVLAGRKTLDSETWQVAPEVAAFLGWAHLTSVISLEIRNGTVRATRATDEGSEVVELPWPIVCAIARPAREPDEALPVPEAGGRISTWSAADLVPDARPGDKRFGQPGSPTRVLAVRDVTPDRGGKHAETSQQAAEEILRLLTQRPRPENPWDKPERLGEQPGASYDCWTLVELHEGRPSRVSLELLAKGRELAGKLGGRNVALLIGAEVREAATEAGRRGAELVCTLEDEALAEYQADVWTAALRHVLERERPHVLLIPATIRGRDLGPRVAGELQLGMTADCVELGIDRAGRLIQHKPAYGGNIVSVIMGATTPQLATVRPRMFEPLEPRTSVAELRALDANDLPEASGRLVESRTEDQPPYRLDEAEIVVCAGAGVASAEDVQALEQLASASGLAVGGDRGACAAGLIPWGRHIGLLGRSVAPRLYLAVGAAGDFEHLSGSVKAAVVVAVGGGEELRAAADVSVTAPWQDFLPPLLEALPERL